MLKITNLHFEYEDRQILKDINLAVAESSLLYVRGQNGVGKTTLLKIISGIIKNYAGQIDFNNQSVDFLKSEICYIGHKPALSTNLTIKEHYDLELLDKNTAHSFNDHISMLKLSGCENQLIKNLSSGQIKKVSLLRFLTTRAKLILLDEPFTSLDASTIDVLLKIISKSLTDGKTIILTSHQELGFKDIAYKEYHL